MSKSESYYAEQYDLRQVIVAKCYAIQAGVRIAARDPHFNLKGLFEDLHWCEDTYDYLTLVAVGSTLRMYREEVKGHLDRARAALTEPPEVGERAQPVAAKPTSATTAASTTTATATSAAAVTRTAGDGETGIASLRRIAVGEPFTYHGYAVQITHVSATGFSFATTNPMDEWHKWTLSLPPEQSTSDQSGSTDEEM